MEQKECIKVSRATKVVPPEKFDRHMKRARLNDIEARKSAFRTNTEAALSRVMNINNIKPSTY